jgi:hypothetical protein
MVELDNDDETESGDSGTRLRFGVLLFSLFAVFAVVAALVFRPGPASSDVRIRNETGHFLSHVVVNGQLYEDIAAGKTGEYRALGVAYRYGSVRFNIGTREMRLTPEDYVGEEPLGKGKFTYALKIVDDDKIVITAGSDSPCLNGDPCYSR